MTERSSPDAISAPTARDESAHLKQQYPNSPDLWGGEPRQREGGLPDPVTPAPPPVATPVERLKREYPESQELWAEGNAAQLGNLRLPTGVDASSQELVEFRAATKGLDATAAQKVLDWHFSLRSASDAALQASWAAAAQADREIGGARLDAARADSRELLTEFGNESLRNLVAGPMGDHPEVIRFLTKVSRALRQSRGRR